MGHGRSHYIVEQIQLTGWLHLVVVSLLKVEGLRSPHALLVSRPLFKTNEQ